MTAAREVTAETLTDAEMIALARIEAAGHFKLGAPPIDPVIAKLASGHMRRLTYEMVCSLIDRGLVVRPADTGVRITDAGRSVLAAAINARAKAGAK